MNIETKWGFGTQDAFYTTLLESNTPGHLPKTSEISSGVGRNAFLRK